MHGIAPSEDHGFPEVCGDTPTVSIPDYTVTALHVEVADGDRQVDTVTRELPQPILVRVTNQNGQPLQGRRVWFEIAAGGGSVRYGAYQSTATGLAFERWVLGPTAGEHELAVRLMSPDGDVRTYATVRATVVPDAPIRFTHTIDVPDTLQLTLGASATLPGRADVLAHHGWDNVIALTVPSAWTAPSTATFTGTEVTASAAGFGWLKARGDTTGLFGTLRDSVALLTATVGAIGRTR